MLFKDVFSSENFVTYTTCPFTNITFGFLGRFYWLVLFLFCWYWLDTGVYGWRPNKAEALVCDKEGTIADGHDRFLNKRGKRFVCGRGDFGQCRSGRMEL